MVIAIAREQMASFA